jgi:hypothetical protein
VVFCRPSPLGYRDTLYPEYRKTIKSTYTPPPPCTADVASLATSSGAVHRNNRLRDDALRRRDATTSVAYRVKRNTPRADDSTSVPSDRDTLLSPPSRRV